MGGEAAQKLSRVPADLADASPGGPSPFFLLLFFWGGECRRPKKKCVLLIQYMLFPHVLRVSYFSNTFQMQLQHLHWHMWIPHHKEERDNPDMQYFQGLISHSGKVKAPLPRSGHPPTHPPTFAHLPQPEDHFTTSSRGPHSTPWEV